ncbi:glutathione S-transferase [Penicillium odoratum]|uniref:glutathione S-transferase n=1 Tax=Penicillium odoratum TaxID=1167516 RepID=UPI0025484BEE|nr:glutathione S-transferase [Penicillium odoratum]KAJ5760809.1 glutathione S-transferase [Penicillium odoratum]
MSSRLTIHHLRRSQSERVLWLCEELGIPYQLETHLRRPPNLVAPDEIRKLHWAGNAPIIQDGDICLAETGAIFEYILAKYGNGQLVLPPTHPNYADYVFWLHRENGTTMPSLISLMFMQLNGISKENHGYVNMQRRVDATYEAMDRQLSKFPYLAGEEFTAADCMSLFSLTTFRVFAPFSLEKYPNIVAYLQRVGQRDAYKRAMGKGDPDMEPILSADPPKPLWESS